ncbi:MAG: hypothetical protein AVDCRST_MAG19-1761 [uncultured Thermomicrobiales bacterium]|uniref:Uncharacterized protein n=1 Tax=uncultured Thermomicrobiales bacterium TaxID=1645740 RepID=A0A6J4UX58_9BACT|nr:MAG: hypothetical protein AVDCRST_MAG19-1761 [uncultured Thermomicrobiales bacterium]
MDRLLAEAGGPVRLVGGVACPADATGRTPRSRRALARHGGDEVTRTFLQVLAERDAEPERGDPGKDEDRAWSPASEEAARAALLAAAGGAVPSTGPAVC